MAGFNGPFGILKETISGLSPNKKGGKFSTFQWPSPGLEEMPPGYKKHTTWFIRITWEKGKKQDVSHHLWDWRNGMSDSEMNRPQAGSCAS
jgi:hypothetical protein